MNKKYLKNVRILGMALLIALATQSFQKVYAKEIIVTCYKTGNCEMEPSAGDALFDKEESDNTNMLPGDFIYRTIRLVNKTNETCGMVLKKIKNIRLGATTFADFPSKMWTALETSHGTAFGTISGGYPTSASTLQDLFEAENLGITKVPAFSEDKVNWLVRFDPTTGNPYQRAEVWFDFDMLFQCQAVSVARFTLAKTNFSWPEKLSVGDEVTYKLIVTTEGMPVRNVNVVDGPPDNVKYIKGSWTAISTVRGDMRANGQATEPSYQSPGTWALGNMAADEVITLTYRGIIDNAATNGIYKDLAWAYGDSYEDDRLNDGFTQISSLEGTSRILASSVTSDFAVEGGVITNEFVGTQILIDQKVKTNTKKVSIPTKEIEGEVLGATTQMLPATGATIFVTAGIAVITVIGILITLIPSLKKKSKAHVTASLFIFALVATLAGKSVYAQNPLVLRVSEPRTPDNKAFIVDYVALDTSEVKKAIEVTCEKKNPDDTFFTLLSQTSTKPGGDSGMCLINESDLGKEGTYIVRVTADNGELTVFEEVAVLYKSTGPKKPVYIEKEKENSCEYDIKVKTADDSKTSYIEVYRSDKKEFTVGSGTLVKTKSIGADEIYKFTHKLYGNDCGSSYYAVRAFDAAGNPSDVRTEVIEKIIDVEGDSETTEAGILPGTPAGGIGGVSGEVIEGAEGTEVGLEGSEEGTEPGESGEEGEESGEEGEEGEEPEVLGAETRRKITSWLIPLALVAFIAYSVVKSKRGKPKSQQ